MKVYESDVHAEKAIISWWRKNKYYIGITFLAVIMISSTFVNINQYHEKVDNNIATKFYYIVPGLISGDSEIALKQVKDLKQEHPNSVYSALASFIVAKYYVDKQDYLSAKDELTWVLNNPHPNFHDKAKLSLARVNIQIDNYEDALSLLDSVKDYKEEVLMVTGDLYAVKKEFSKAKNSYKKALEYCKGDDNEEICDLIRMKYNNINFVKPHKALTKKKL